MHSYVHAYARKCASVCVRAYVSMRLRGKKKGPWRCEHGRQRSMCVPCGGKGICPHERRRWACRICCPDGRSHLSCTWLNQHLSHIAGKFARCAHALMQYVFTPADRCTPARSRAHTHTHTHTHAHTNMCVRARALTHAHAHAHTRTHTHTHTHTRTHDTRMQALTSTSTHSILRAW